MVDHSGAMLVEKISRSLSFKVREIEKGFSQGSEKKEK